VNAWLVGFLSSLFMALATLFRMMVVVASTRDLPAKNGDVAWRRPKTEAAIIEQVIQFTTELARKRRLVELGEFGRPLATSDDLAAHDL
jgi:hypothetical protein